MADKILNTGLDALLGDVATPNKQTIKEIELDQIKPNRFQPRQSFDEQKINELSQSIAKHGILSPILVRETGAGGYELIAGERRLRAAKQAGLQKAPCMVDSAEDQLSLELALIENLQREDLNPIEEARGYDRLKREFSLTQDKIAEVTGKARSSVANSMRLLNLPTAVIDLLYSGDLEKGHAKILASMDPKEAEELAQKIVSLGMTVKDAATSNQTPTSNNQNYANNRKDKKQRPIKYRGGAFRKHRSQNSNRPTIHLKRKDFYFILINRRKRGNN